MQNEKGATRFMSHVLYYHRNVRTTLCLIPHMQHISLDLLVCLVRKRVNFHSSTKNEKVNFH